MANQEMANQDMSNPDFEDLAELLHSLPGWQGNNTVNSAMWIGYLIATMNFVDLLEFINSMEEEFRQDVLNTPCPLFSGGTCLHLVVRYWMNDIPVATECLQMLIQNGANFQPDGLGMLPDEITDEYFFNYFTRQLCHEVDETTRLQRQELMQNLHNLRPVEYE